MPTDLSRPTVLHVYRCDHCGRQFDSHGGWAWGAAQTCEAECLAAKERGEVRVFLSPPGQYDTMFRDKYWRFVKLDSAEHECATGGHVVEQFWRSWGRAEKREWLWYRCTRCGWEHERYPCMGREASK